jgi:hypothetical protein
MNTGRTIVDNYILPDGPVNLYWLVGFLIIYKII